MKATSPSVIQTAEAAHSFSALGSLPTNLTTIVGFGQEPAHAITLLI
jgi:hypothetical protein